MLQRHYTAAEQSERKARIAAYLAAHPGASPHAVAAALGIPRTSVRRHMATVKFCVGKTANPVAVDVAATPGGFELAGRKLLAAKPTDVWKARFYGLRRGCGYRIEYLAEQWGNSADTVRSQAKRHGSLRYVEDTDRPGEYMACAVHPETPKGI